MLGSTPQWIGACAAVASSNAIWCGLLNQTARADREEIERRFEDALPGLTHLTEKATSALYTDAMDVTRKTSNHSGMRDARMNLSRVEAWMSEYHSLARGGGIGFEGARARRFRESERDRVKSWTHLVATGNSATAWENYLSHRCVVLKRKNACRAMSVMNE